MLYSRSLLVIHFKYSSVYMYVSISFTLLNKLMFLLEFIPSKEYSRLVSRLKIPPIPGVEVPLVGMIAARIV